MISIPQRNRILWTSLTLAAAARVGAFVYAMLWPITDQGGRPVSPLLPQVGSDFAFYVQSLELYRSTSIGGLIGKFIDFYSQPIAEQMGHIIPGPVLPALIWLTDYRSDNVLPLALVFLVLGIALAWLWILWLERQGLPGLWLILFALLPNPLWFMLNVSSDLPFAVFFGVFYVAYLRERWSGGTLAAWLTALALILLTRPNGYSLLLFVMLDLVVLRTTLSLRTRRALGAGMAIAVLAFSIYLYPYFITEVKRNLFANSYLFFGYSHAAFAHGIYESLPTWLNLPLSWLTLVASKILYFCGLRPSFGDIPTGLLLLRAAVGIVLLPGLAYGFLYSDNRHRLLLGLYLLPIMLAAAQDRYNLPLQPLLFYFGASALAGLPGLARRLGSRLASADQRQRLNGLLSEQGSSRVAKDQGGDRLAP